MSDKQNKKFALEYIEPYSTFNDEGKPRPIPMVVQGLLPQGGFSVLGACPKAGKSSLSRYLTVGTVKGTEFLGRGTTQGDVILASLEDPRQQTDNCLHALGYKHNSTNDARIHILEKLPARVDETVDVLGNDLVKKPDVKLVIIDTLAKVLRVKDLNDYSLVLEAIEKIKNLARAFPALNVLCLTHCKKIKTEDPFERLLGSTALRGEPDTNIVIYKEGDLNLLATEGRMGKMIPRSILQSTLAECEGSDVVTNFSLGQSLDQYEAEHGNKMTRKQVKGNKASLEERFRTYFMSCPDFKSGRQKAMDSVIGNDRQKAEALEAMEDNGEVEVHGVSRSTTNPLTVTFRPGNNLKSFVERFSPEEAL